MPSIADAAKAMRVIAKKLSALPLNTRVQETYSLTAPIAENPSAPNPFLRTTMPSSLILQPDSTRQFFNSAIPQVRVLPLTPGANLSIGSAINSRVSPTGVSTVTPPIPPVPPVPPDVFYEINGDSTTLGTMYSVNGIPL